MNSDSLHGRAALGGKPMPASPCEMCWRNQQSRGDVFCADCSAIANELDDELITQLDNAPPRAQATGRR